MAKQVLNVGAIKNDGTGDTLRDGAKKINDNFTELYNALGATSGQLSLVSRITSGDGIAVSSPSGAVIVTAKTASTTVLGSIKVGENLTIDNDGVLSANAGAYTLPVAQRGTLGGIKVGDTLQISETGVVNVVNDLYTLPTATSQVLGGIKVGARLTITNGVLSADVQSIPTATTSIKGGVIVDGITIGINGSGVISVLGSGNSLRNGDVSFTLESNGVLTLPTAGALSNNGHYWYFNNDGTVTLPPTGGIRLGNVITTVEMPYITALTPQVIWSSTDRYISGVKLLITVEGNVDGDNTGWHTQTCEAVIASRGSPSIGDPVMSVYGLVYTSPTALAEFSVRRNNTTGSIEVLSTQLAANNGNGLYFRIQATESSSRD